MLRATILLAITLFTLTGKAQNKFTHSEIAGSYDYGNEWTGGCILTLKANGTYDYNCGYDISTLDRSGTGRYKIKGDTVLLTSKHKMPPEKKQFKVVEEIEIAGNDTKLEFVSWNGKGLKFNNWGAGEVMVEYADTALNYTAKIDSVGKVTLHNLKRASLVKAWVRRGFLFTLNLNTQTLKYYRIKTAKAIPRYIYFINEVFLLSRVNGKVDCQPAIVRY